VQLRSTAPDAFQFTDGMTGALDLPRLRYPEAGPRSLPPRGIPEIAGKALAPVSSPPARPACRSASEDVGGGSSSACAPKGSILGLQRERRPAILGNRAGAAHVRLRVDGAGRLAIRRAVQRPPGRSTRADICAELSALPEPRVLVTTPFHLRTLLDAGVDSSPRSH
jgi:hypothetical protein